jgi:hypothetical protein
VLALGAVGGRLFWQQGVEKMVFSNKDALFNFMNKTEKWLKYPRKSIIFVNNHKILGDASN